MATNFEDAVDTEFARPDTLVVLARGLGMAGVLSRFVAERAKPGRLIVAVNIPRQVAVEVIWPAVLSAVRKSRPVDPAMLLPRFINADYSVRDRASVYGIGGFVIATASVLVNDLLLRNIPAEIVDGICVFAAEKVCPSSNVHFALKLFRMQNKAAFINAISENALGLCSGFHNVEKVMRTLYVSNLSLWPRFHKTVKESLARRTPDVLDLSVPVSSSQGAVIAALRDIAIRILDDLRVASRSLDLSDVFQKPEVGQTQSAKLAPNFDEIVRRQLMSSADERNVPGGEKSRRLVADLSAIRVLLHEALHLNCILFYQHLITIRHTQGRSSYWLMRQEAQQMLLLARSRIWRRTKVETSAIHSASATIAKRGKRPRLVNKPAPSGEDDDVVYSPVLDSSPKWKALKAVLEEIETDVKEIGPAANVGRVLVLVRDQSQLDELHQIFTVGAECYLLHLLKEAFPKVYGEIPRDVLREKIRATNADGKHETVNTRRMSPNVTVSSLVTRDNGNDIQEDTHSFSGPSASALRQITLTQLGIVTPDVAQRARVPSRELSTDASSRRQRARLSGSSASNGERLRGTNFASKQRLPGKKMEFSNPDPWPWPVRIPPNGMEDCLPGLRSYFGRETPENPVKKVEVLLWCSDWVDAQGRGLRLLQEYRPSFIVMYNADISFMRQVEVFKSCSPGHPVRLYLLSYSDVIEENQSRNMVERERSAFKSLIRERATMVIHIDQNGRSERIEEVPSEIALQSIGRRGLGADRDSRLTQTQLVSGRCTIIVDTRELRSALPMMLFEAGINIVPVTLEVGDFVLSKHVAVERKSVPDLYGSFGSGRLFNQVEALCRHYKEACLLIEFDADSILSLGATSGGISTELVPGSIISKTVLLVQQFPSLHLLWSKGPHDTAGIFRSLKLTEEEPDVSAATAMGVDRAEATDASFNSAPVALLRSLPGIDGNNMTMVMRKVRNVSELLVMTVEEMTKVLGSSSKAQLLHDFVNEEPSEALAAL